MADLTMGQRISEQRKKLGLSQEALGEKMGVSRQAISKWEADAAVPEIDKLIALSKLFGVSVGWLLGVEETPAQQAEVLPEAQLQLIEQIVKKYQPQPAKRKWLPTAILAVCLSGAVMLMWARQGNMQNRLAANEAQLEAVHYQLNNALAAMESQIVASQTPNQTPATALLADYTLEIAGIVSGDRPQAEIRFSAVPNTWMEGDCASLSIRRDGAVTVTQACTWDGAFLTARTFLEVADGYELCLTLTHSDGTQDQQVLNDPYIQKLDQTLNLTAEVTSGQWHYEDKTLALKNYQFKVGMPPLGKYYGSMAWEEIDLILALRNGEEIGRFNLLSAQKEEDADVLASYEIWMERTEIKFCNLELPADAGILLWLYAETNNGLTMMHPVTGWATDSAGKLRSTTVQ